MDADLSLELRKIEMAIATRISPEPAPELRNRVMDAIRAARRSELVVDFFLNDPWKTLAAAAAAMLLAFNFMLNSISTGTARAALPKADAISDVSLRLHDLAPGLNAEEIRSLALIHASGMPTPSRLGMEPNPVVRLELSDHDKLIKEE